MPRPHLAVTVPLTVALMGRAACESPPGAALEGQQSTINTKVLPGGGDSLNKAVDNAAANGDSATSFDLAS